MAVPCLDGLSRGWPGSKQGLTPFAMVTFAPSDRKAFPFLFSTGLAYQGLISGYECDATAFRLAYGKFSRDLRGQDFEMILEQTHEVALAPSARLPRVQVTVLILLQLSWLAEAEPKVTPRGSVSITVSPVADEGLLLVTVSLKVRGSLTFRGSRESVFLTARSAPSLRLVMLMVKASSTNRPPKSVGRTRMLSLPFVSKSMAALVLSRAPTMVNETLSVFHASESVVLKVPTTVPSGLFPATLLLLSPMAVGA
ncbi:MAG TPA: hypothetical protein VGC99_17880 [Candidatus Tectomicrobia bacterium]